MNCSKQFSLHLLFLSPKLKEALQAGFKVRFPRCTCSKFKNLKIQIFSAAASIIEAEARCLCWHWAAGAEVERRGKKSNNNETARTHQSHGVVNEWCVNIHSNIFTCLSSGGLFLASGFTAYCVKHRASVGSNGSTVKKSKRISLKHAEKLKSLFLRGLLSLSEGWFIVAALLRVCMLMRLNLFAGKYVELSRN